MTSLPSLTTVQWDVYTMPTELRRAFDAFVEEVDPQADLTDPGTLAALLWSFRMSYGPNGEHAQVRH